MFSYCLNNPVALFDESGDRSIWSILVGNGHFGYIHSRVIIDILTKYNDLANPEYFSECWLIGMKNRADIVSTCGMIWEIKSAYACEEAAIAGARKQANSYLNGITISGNIYLRQLGLSGTFEGSFYVYAEGQYFYVTYWTPYDGVILYNVSEGQQEATENCPVYNYSPRKQKKNNSYIVVPVPVPIPAGGWGGGGGAPWQNILRPQVA